MSQGDAAGADTTLLLLILRYNDDISMWVITIKDLGDAIHINILRFFHSLRARIIINHTYRISTIQNASYIDNQWWVNEYKFYMSRVQMKSWEDVGNRQLLCFFKA
jgi:hypothetical protein